MTLNILDDVRHKDFTSGLPNDRHTAIHSGSTKYFTGRPCRKGHTVYRYTASGICAECASIKAKHKWSGGWRQSKTNRETVNLKWNDSSKGKEAKIRWRQKNPQRAWAVCATGGAKMRARLKNLAFNLTSDYIESLITSNCPVFGEPLLFIGGGQMTPYSPSIDRINPSLGYIKGNVIIISMKANSIKNCYTSEDIRKVADWLENIGH